MMRQRSVQSDNISVFFVARPRARASPSWKYTASQSQNVSPCSLCRLSFRLSFPLGGIRIAYNRKQLSTVKVSTTKRGWLNDSSASRQGFASVNNFQRFGGFTTDYSQLISSHRFSLPRRLTTTRLRACQLRRTPTSSSKYPTQYPSLWKSQRRQSRA